MVNKYRQGVILERAGCKKAVAEGALLAGRFASSKNWGVYKIDTVEIYDNRVVLTQYKKGAMSKKEKDGLKELAELLIEPVPVIVRYVERKKEVKK